MLKDKIIGGGIVKKFIILTVGIIILFDILTAIFMQIDMDKTLSEELNGRGKLLSNHLAEESGDALLRGDAGDLKKLAENVKRSDYAIKYAYITDAQNNILARTFEGNFTKGSLVLNSDNTSSTVIDFKSPILNGSAGFAHVGMDRIFIDEKIARATNIALANILIEGVLGVLMAYIAGNYLIRPIRSLVKGAEEIGRGNLRYKIEPGSNDDEILTLSNAFNQMSYNLNKSISELSASEEKYRNLIELTTDIIYLSDREGKQIFMNDAAYRILETTPEEVIGHPWLKWIHPNERENTYRKFKEMIEKGIDVFNFENRYISKSGKTIDVLHNVRILRNENGEIIGTQGIARDITERKQAENLIRESERYLSMIIESSFDGIGVLDEHGRFEFGNDSFFNIIGWPKEELIGQSLMKVFSEDVRGLMQERWQKRQEGIKMPYETKIKTKSDEIRYIYISHAQAEIRGEKKYIDIIKDITDKKEIEKLEKQLLQSDKLATIGQLAAGVAHEVNNPLGNISLYTQMLLKKTENGNTKDKLNTILDEADRAAQIIRGLLDFARESELRLNPIDMNKEIGKVLRILDIQLKDLDIQNPQLKDIKVTTDFGSLPLILADSGQIRQVIMNILTNSIQSITKNGEIIIKTAAKEDYVETIISDNGCGIPKENLNKIFNPFFTTKGHDRGIGLGLSICYGIIKRHNGSIEVESEVGKGTTFTIRLPK